MKYEYYSKEYNLTKEETISLMLSNPDYFLEDMLRLAMPYIIAVQVIRILRDVFN